MTRKTPNISITWGRSTWPTGSIRKGGKEPSARRPGTTPPPALYQKNLGTALFADRNYKKGWLAYQEALKLDPQIFDHSGSIRVENPGTIQDRGAMNYYMAKGCMKAGLPDRAIEYLRLALNEGFTTPKKVIADAEFNPLHKMPAFLEMMAAQGVYLNGISAHPPVQQ